MGVQSPEVIDATLCTNSYGGLNPKIIEATLCVNSYGGLDPQKNSRENEAGRCLLTSFPVARSQQKKIKTKKKTRNQKK